MKLVFMGTPEFGREILAALLKSSHEVAAIVTQPDRPKGRSKKTVPSPVKELALEKELEILQPAKASEAGLLDKLSEISPDAIAVAAYGCILPAGILAVPPKGCINVHGSLLPKYRGASPVASAILAGENETGVTLQLMAPECDAGDILAQRAIPIENTDTTGTLLERLAETGGPMLVDLLNRIEAGTEIPRRAQDHDSATMTKQIKKSDGRIDWTKSAAEIDRLVRAMNPWPSAFTLIETEKGKPLLRITVHAARVGDSAAKGKPGTVLDSPPGNIRITTGEGVLQLTELQAAGKKRMTAENFLRGTKIPPGARCING